MYDEVLRLLRSLVRLVVDVFTADLPNMVVCFAKLPKLLGSMSQLFYKILQIRYLTFTICYRSRSVNSIKPSRHFNPCSHDQSPVALRLPPHHRHRLLYIHHNSTPPYLLCNFSQVRPSWIFLLKSTMSVEPPAENQADLRFGCRKNWYCSRSLLVQCQNVLPVVLQKWQQTKQKGTPARTFHSTPTMSHFNGYDCGETKKRSIGLASWF